jgi:hypothetical protein
LFDNTGFNLFEFAGRTINSLFTNILSQEKLFALWNLVFFEGAAKAKKRGIQILFSAFVAILLNMAHILLSATPGVLTDEFRNFYIECSDAQKIEWRILVEGQFNFDVFGFIHKTLEIRDRYFVEGEVDPNELPLVERIYSAAMWWWGKNDKVKGVDLWVEDKLYVVFEQYRELFEKPGKRNQQLFKLYESYKIRERDTEKLWPNCINFKSYQQILQAAFPGDRDVMGSEYQSRVNNESLTDKTQQLILKSGNLSLWIEIENIEFIGRGDKFPLVVEHDGLDHKVVAAGGYAGDSRWSIPVKSADLDKPVELNFRIGSDNSSNSKDPRKTLRIGLLEGKHWHCVNFGNVCITLSTWFTAEGADWQQAIMSPNLTQDTVDRIFKKR